MALVLGSRKLERKCTFWESCLDGGEGGLQGLVIGMRASEESSKGEAEIRAGLDEEQRKPVVVLLLRESALRSRNESRTRRANRRTSLKMWEEGDPLLSLGALALLENGWRTQGLDTSGEVNMHGNLND